LALGRGWRWDLRLRAVRQYFCGSRVNAIQGTRRKTTHEFVASAPVGEEALGGEPLFASIMSTALTGPELLSAFWYDALWPISCASDIMFQPFCCITGYADMKVATDWLDSSCSRIISPGLFGPVSHWIIDALILVAVVPGGESVRLQSSVL
jgi:hypothetical protein